MISSGLLSALTEGVDELTSPMVYLAPEHHAFLVLGDGEAPLITWSKSFRFACEQADIHGGVVVAVPIVRDSSWREAHRDDPTQVPFPKAKFVHRYGDPAPRPPLDVRPKGYVCPVCGHGDAGHHEGGCDHMSAGGQVCECIVPFGRPVAPAGYPLGRAATGDGRAESADGWSSERPDVVGQEQTPSAGLVQRVEPFGDPEAPALPMDREEALRAAFDGNERAVQAFHARASNDDATLEAVRDALR